MAALNIEIDPELKKALKKFCADRVINIKQFAAEALSEALESKQEEAGELKKTTLVLGDELAQDLRVALAKRGLLLQDAMDQAVRMWLKGGIATVPASEGSTVSNAGYGKNMIKSSSTLSDTCLRLVGELLRSGNDVILYILHRLLLALSEIVERPIVREPSKVPGPARVAKDQQRRMDEVREIIARLPGDKDRPQEAEKAEKTDEIRLKNVAGKPSRTPRQGGRH